MTFSRNLLALLSITLMAACGGGGGGSSANNQPTTTPTSQGKTITSKMSTTGTPSAQLAGIGITMTLPDGVTPALASDGSVAASVVTISGVAAPGSVLAPVYTPASGSTKGTLQIGLASQAPAGFGAGDFATISLASTAATNPVAADFPLSGFNPIDVTGNAATGLTAWGMILSIK
jgi:hypothetical protein